MELRFTKKAIKELKKLGKPVSTKIVDKLKEVAKDPFAKNNNLKPLTGVQNGYRLSVKPHRALYIVLKDEQIIEVYRVGHRKDVYE
tara:strand:- start:354 stop:611 length:258 start_codon:yes stop_codon:yes gene_type:complete